MKHRHCSCGQVCFVSQFCASLRYYTVRTNNDEIGLLLDSQITSLPFQMRSWALTLVLIVGHGVKNMLVVVNVNTDLFSTVCYHRTGEAENSSRYQNRVCVTVVGDGNS